MIEINDNVIKNERGIRMNDFNNQNNDFNADNQNVNGQNLNEDFVENTDQANWRRVENQDTFSPVKEEQYYAPPTNNALVGAQTKPKKNTGLKVFAVVMTVVFVFTAVVFTGYYMYNEGIFEKDEVSPPSEEVQDENIDASDDDAQLNILDAPEGSSDGSILAEGELSSEEIAEKVSPSVVGIMTYVTDDRTMTEQAYGIGSGVIMSEDGYIITNAHVVMLEDNVTPVNNLVVYLDNGDTEVATLVGIDVKTDLAVIKIERNDLVAADFGNSDEIEVGEKAVAIGSPTSLTFLNSFSQGVISGVDRTIAIDSTGNTLNAIQTDAAINPGNSGGALVNKYGQVIGINSSKIAGTEVEGMGFAIPINEAKPVIEDLIENGFVTDRVRIGITFQSITEALSEIIGVPQGLRVISVSPEVDAYTKGVLAGDVITHIDGQQVVVLEDVSEIFEDKVAGDTITLTIFRSTETIEIEVILHQDTSGKIIG